MPTMFKWEMPNLFWCGCSRPSPSRSISAPRQSLAPAVSTSQHFTTTSGNPLEGGKTYRLHVPANVPVRQFWSVTVYSLETSSFFLNATRLTLGSLDKDLKKNADGTVDIYFGPKPPAGQESNWLYTQPGRNGSRGSACTARRRRSSTKVGSYRTSRMSNERREPTNKRSQHTALTHRRCTGTIGVLFHQPMPFSECFKNRPVLTRLSISRKSYL